MHNAINFAQEDVGQSEASRTRSSGSDSCIQAVLVQLLQESAVSV